MKQISPVFSDIFKTFMQHFPPVETYTEGITLKLTTAELAETFNSFYPDAEPGLLADLMIENGYLYKPIESSETIKFYWIIGRA
jgi:hypothetical protein